MNKKWEVILTKSENEPWWFFDGWENDITECFTYTDKDEAQQQYLSFYKRLDAEFDHVKIKNSSLAVFWNSGELLYCDSCGDDLQIYYGLIILYNKKPFLFLDSSHESELSK